MSAKPFKLSALHPDSVLKTEIPAIRAQCASMRDETEQAASTFLSIAEAISSAAQGLDAANRQLITSSVTELLEQCHFQDFVGQRLAEIEKHLSHIHGTITDITTQVQFDAPREVNESAAEKLMHGPQSGKKAPSQADVDKLFNS